MSSAKKRQKCLPEMANETSVEKVSDAMASLTNYKTGPSKWSTMMPKVIDLFEKELEEKGNLLDTLRSHLTSESMKLIYESASDDFNVLTSVLFSFKDAFQLFLKTANFYIKLDALKADIEKREPGLKFFDGMEVNSPAPSSTSTDMFLSEGMDQGTNSFPSIKIKEEMDDEYETADANEYEQTMNGNDFDQTMDDEQLGSDFDLHDSSSYRIVRRGDGKIVYQCVWSNCDRLYETKASILRHRKLHTLTASFGAYKCNKCDRRFPTVKSLQCHQHIHSKTTRHIKPLIVFKKDNGIDAKYYKCPLVTCNRLFKSSGTFRAHRLRHSNRKNTSSSFKCNWPGCGEEFFNQRDICLHKKRHAEKMIQCYWPDCGVICKNVKMFNNHLWYRHLKSLTSMVCDWQECDEEFTKESDLRRHKLLHLSESGEFEELKSSEIIDKIFYRCGLCGVIVDPSEPIKIHMRKHINEKKAIGSNPANPETNLTQTNSVQTVVPENPGLVSDLKDDGVVLDRPGHVLCCICFSRQYVRQVERRFGRFLCHGCKHFFTEYIKKPQIYYCDFKGTCSVRRESEFTSTGVIRNKPVNCKACLLKLGFQRLKFKMNIRDKLIPQFFPRVLSTDEIITTSVLTDNQLKSIIKRELENKPHQPNGPVVKVELIDDENGEKENEEASPTIVKRETVKPEKAVTPKILAKEIYTCAVCDTVSDASKFVTKYEVVTCKWCADTFSKFTIRLYKSPPVAPCKLNEGCSLIRITEHGLTTPCRFCLLTKCLEVYQIGDDKLRALCLMKLHSNSQPTSDEAA